MTRVNFSFKSSEQPGSKSMPFSLFFTKFGIPPIRAPNTGTFIANISKTT